MRLKSIQLAGFKSFVDPTTVPFQSNMTAVVGPNGCGKSNIIDAVRWVMGESSAKHLRGESMADVIFNGSLRRQPVGRAAIELIFDNQSGRAGGEFARFSEISVKREVTRDGQSRYFLNGSVCRRRDVTALFLGTGLGPRSYAIIEQGMIARLIEAKPEELRTYVEEAAGVSRYKERRRETETRIERTRDNLDRLTDLSDELGRQLERLKRQAEAAEKFQRLRAEIRGLEALRDHYALEAVLADEQAATGALRSAERSLMDVQTEQARLERDRTAAVVARDDLSQAVERANAAYYQHQALLSRLDAARQAHQHTLKDVLNRQAQLEQALGEVQRLRAEDERAALEARAALESLKPRCEQLAVERSHIEAAIAEVEADLARQEADRGRLASELGQLKAECARLESAASAIDRQSDRQSRRLTEVQHALAQLADTDPDVIAALAAEVTEIESQLRQATEAWDAAKATVEAAESVLTERRRIHQAAEREAQTARLDLEKSARIVASEARIDDRAIRAWASELPGLMGRALEHIQIPEAARVGFEAAYPEWLDAFVVADVTALDLDRVPAGVRILEAAALQTLAQQLKHSDAPWQHPSGFTDRGFKYGPGWVERVAHQATGVLDVQARLPDLQVAVQACEATLNTAKLAMDDSQRAWDQHRADETQSRQRAASLQSTQVTLSQRLAGMRARAEEVKESRLRLSREVSQLRQASAVEVTERDAISAALTAAHASKQALQTTLQPIYRQLDERKALLASHRQRLQQIAREETDALVRMERLSGSVSRAQAQITRLDQQISQQQAAYDQLETEAVRAREHPPVTEQALADALDQGQVLERALAEHREALTTADHALRDLEQVRNDLDSRREQAQSVLADCRLTVQALSIERARYEAQLSRRAIEPSDWLRLLQQATDAQAVEEALAQCQRRIERLGAINLVAVEEYQRELERKTALDLQHAELTGALATLEEAIRKIDRETRALFRQTFDAINQSFGEIFPELFGGGEAFLTLTDDDLLHTGVSIMARPPGKRNSSIFLLSGGEKALTALSLVFAIFRLNPAPFCLLDEVDAPLDDANVGRYADAVAKMAANVQFIYITHNKIAMERAGQLMGVTMSEPGVSRLVSVDIERAVELAGQE